jgi:ABC-type nitrate/sulfonate/bicarbonate transport system permease component
LKGTQIIAALAVLVLIGFVLNRSCRSADLKVTPEAAEQIEKAKRR